MKSEIVAIITALCGMMGTVVASMITVKKRSQQIEIKNELRLQKIESTIEILQNNQKIIEEVTDRLVSIEKMMVGFKKDLEYIKKGK